MICPICNQEVEKLTKEHVIPKWFMNPQRLSLLGLRNQEIKKWGEFANKNITRICKHCNTTKGGKLDFNNPVVRNFINEIIIMWNNELSKYEKNRPRR